MTLENTSLQELIDFNNLLRDDQDTYEDWHEAFNDDDQIRTELIDSITSFLKSNHYDGPNDYQTIYWFAKGLKLPAPQKPKRYVDSDKYLFNNLHKFKIHDKLNDFSRKRIHDRFNRDLHKKDSSFSSDLMKHRNDFQEFHHSMNDLPNDDLDGMFTPKDLNKMTIDSFN